MALTIDQLNIEIASDSSKASRALTNLTKKLSALSAAMSPLEKLNISIANSFNKTTQSVQKTGNEVNSAGNKVEKSKKSFSDFTKTLTISIVKMRTIIGAAQRLASVFADCFKESNKYIETLNLFNVTMGDGADAAIEYANEVSKAMGIDPAEWMQNQGTFKQLTSGFGVASDKANIMSQNLTQLSYDLASFFNTDVETSFDKLSSAMAGQVKGLREFGIDTSVASLQEYALSRGITQNVSSMSQAEKSLLRYNLIMERSTLVQGDMARTLVTPANALRILSAQLVQAKRAIGNIVSVIVVQFIPYVQAMVQIITEAATAIASLFGFSLPEIDYSGLNTGAGGFADDMEDAADATGSAVDNIKKLKKQLMGFDELNILSSPDNSSGGGGSGGASGGGSGLDMDVGSYDFLKNLDTSKVDECKEKLKDILAIVGEVALGLLTWKLSSKFLSSLEALSVATGLVLLIDSIRAIFKDGLSVKSIIEGAIGGALIGAGLGFKFGGWSGAIGGIIIGIGVSLLITGVASMLKEGITKENAVTVITGALGTASGVFAVIKLFNKKVKSPVKEIETASENLDAVSTGTSSLTGKLKNIVKDLGYGIAIIAEVAAAAILVVGAVWVLGEELKLVAEAWQPVIENADTVAIAMGIGTGLLVVIGGLTYLLGTAGGSLCGTLGIGIAVLAELGVATGLFLLEIWAIGEGLNQIALAWQPVLTNGDTIIAAIVVGTALLVGIGAVTALLGVASVATAGALPLAIGLGTALLLELGIAAGLFIEEIVVIGDGLTRINDAWQPILANSESVATAIEKGTELLIIVGGATALLGVASVATVGLLPLAIKLGTDLLIDLGKAFKAFADNLVSVADKITNDLHPALKDMNRILPPLSKNLDNFIEFMKTFAGQIVSYSKSSAISGLAATISSIIGFFSKDPIESLANDVEKEYNQAIVLNENLEIANPELETAIDLITSYYSFLSKIESLTGENSNINLANGMFVNMKEVGKNLVLGFVAGMKSKMSDLRSSMASVLSDSYTSDDAWNSGYNVGKSMANGISYALRTSYFPTLTGTVSVGGGNLASLKLRAYASGGFPDMGQLFIAREAGAELVGNIGNKTAVVNNEQIISGIERAVYKAMSSANGGKDINITINSEIDGDRVGSSVVKYHNGVVMQTGESPLLI